MIRVSYPRRGPSAKEKEATTPIASGSLSKVENDFHIIGLFRETSIPLSLSLSRRFKFTFPRSFPSLLRLITKTPILLVSDRCL